MRLRDLSVKNFRNYKELRLEFSPQVNFFHGPNGAGKTNILEMVQLVILGESFRVHDLNHITPKNFEAPTNIRATVDLHGSNHQLQFQFADGRKKLLRNDKPDSQKKRYAQFSTVVFSPESLSAIKDEPAVRRKLIDQALMGLYPDSVQVIADYTRILKSRNELLKNMAESPDKSTALQSDLLESVNEVFLRAALELTYSRIKLIEKLQKKFSVSAKKVLQLQDVDIGVDYVISGDSAFAWSMEEVYDSLLSRMRDLAVAERAAGRSLIGPHKHDVRFNFEGRDARMFCSQGQQRALILAFKIAQIEAHNEVHGTHPILLLDDVMSELDEQRRESLVNLLRSTPAQIFITTTEREHGPKLHEREMAMFFAQDGVAIKEG